MNRVRSACIAISIQTSGVPTFGGAKVAIWPEDLVAGNVDVAIVGVPSNVSSGVRDAAWAPMKCVP